MSATRYHTLDHWRGLAALWVVFFHACALWERPAAFPFTALHDFGRLGWFGVHLFFVISGYCLAECGARAITNKQSVPVFLLDRGCRIYPAYWAALLIAFALALAATPFNHQPVFTAADAVGALPAGYGQVIADAALIAPWASLQPYLLVSWTLTSEIAFYVLIALGIGLIRQVQRPAIALLAGVFIALAQASHLLALPGTVLDLWPEFVCGLLAWVAVHSSRAKTSVTLLATAGIGTLGLLGFILGSPSGTLPFAAAFALLLLVLKRHDESIARLRMLRFAGFLGALSYSLYLVHVPIISPAQNLLHRLLPDAGRAFWIPLLLTALAVIPAWLFYLKIEQPLESWRRRRFRPRIDSTTNPAPGN